MKQLVACAAFCLAGASGATHAAEVRPLIGVGVTSGGDTLVTVQYTESHFGSDNTKVRAGGLLALHAGVDVQFTDIWSMQALVGYHTDFADASNGDVTFDRYPAELLAHYRVNPWFRLGGGARYTANAKLRVSGAAAESVSNQDFKPTWGTVIEGEFFPWRSFGIKLRYVTEKFKSKTFPELSNIDGTHGGLYLSYYFF